MTLAKAIETLTSRSKPRHQYYDQKELPAILLAIEAMRALQRHQRGGRVTQIFLLPGETEEE